MPATIEKLVSATPAQTKEGDGWALVWNGSPQSPRWLSTKAFAELYNALSAPHRAIVDAAKERARVD